MESNIIFNKDFDSNSVYVMKFTMQMFQKYGTILPSLNYWISGGLQNPGDVKR
jgi:hypothetical protein